MSLVVVFCFGVVVGVVAAVGYAAFTLTHPETQP